MQAVCRDCFEMFEPAAETCPACALPRMVAHAELATLAIAHVDCDAFYASVEKRDRPELRGKPLIVGHPGGRGVVTTACYIARRFGVRSAMPMFKALALCPEAEVIPPAMSKYKAVSAEIRDIMRTATEIIEPVSLDEAYLDLTGLLGGAREQPAAALARIARTVEKEVRLSVSIGLAPNKFLAKLASELQKPRGYSVIGRNEARARLAPMPVAKINGVGPAFAAKLTAAGITSIGDLQSLSEMQLTTRFGRFGRRIAHYARGEDDRAVTPDRETKSVSAETTFDQDTGDPAVLNDIAADLCRRVAASLERKSLAGGGVVLKLKTSDFRILSRSRRLVRPTQRASVLLDAARHLIAREADGRTFRLIGVGCDALAPGCEADPPDLFE